MVDAGSVLAFGLVAFGLIVVPGPSVLFIVGRGVALGRRAAVTSALGNNLGLCVQVLAVAAGLGAIVERSIVVFTVIKLAGACYLIYLGIQAIRHRGDLSSLLDAPASEQRTGRIIREGFIVGVSNPKALILFSAILPQFVEHSRGHVPVQMLLFGLVAVLIALVSDSAWALLAGTARAWLGRSARRLEMMSATGGLVMVGLGVRLALTRRHG